LRIRASIPAGDRSQLEPSSDGDGFNEVSTTSLPRWAPLINQNDIDSSHRLSRKPLCGWLFLISARNSCAINASLT
jgi:hypothetical protein